MNVYAQWGLVVAAVIFVNWLVIPLLFKSKSYRDGLATGVIASVILLLAAWAAGKLN